MPFTDVFLQSAHSSYNGNVHEPHLIYPPQVKSESLEAAASKTICVKLLYMKGDSKLMSLEAGADFVDVVFSFLTFPLACVLKLTGKNSLIGCVDNLYGSVEALASCGDYIKSYERKLLSPKLSPHFGCSNQLLRIEENLPGGHNYCYGCKKCRRKWFSKKCRSEGINLRGITKCRHNSDLSSLTELNPKLPYSGAECGGGYAKRSARFALSNEIAVTPLSPISEFDVIKKSKLPISSLEEDLIEKEVTIGEAEVLNILKLCLTSRGTLSDVFFHNKRTKINLS